MNENIKLVWQLDKYGKCYKINMGIIKKINILMAIVIIGLYPLPIAILINKLMPTTYWKRW